MKKLSPQCHGPLLYTAVIFSLLVICILFSNTGCKKNDFTTSGVNPIADIKQKFFYDHRSADPIEKKLVEYIRSQNEQLDFVGKTANQIGYPRWNKTIAIAQKKGSTSSFGSGSDSITLYYIPFVRDSQNYVNASMVISASATDTSFWYNCDWQYKNLPYAASGAAAFTAERYAMFFMLMDSFTLGHSRFAITDTLLFRSPAHTQTKKTIGLRARSGSRRDDSGSISISNLNEQGCIDWYYCGDRLYCTTYFGSNGCDYTNCVADPDVCFLYAEYCFDLPGSGGGNEGFPNEPIPVEPGGGGGNGSGGGPPSDCGGPQGRDIAARGNEPCEDGPGWEPEPPILPIEDPYDPCEVLKTKNTDTAYINKLNYLKTKTNLTVETGFGETKTGVFAALVPTQSTNNSDNLNAPIDSTTRGFSHTHLNDYEVQINDGAFSQQTQYRKPIRIFSPKDVNQLMLLAHWNRFSGDFSQYYVAMVAANGTYILKFTGVNTGIRLDFGSRAWQNHFEESFRRLEDKRDTKLEEFFLKYLKDIMKVTSVSLYKLNDNGTVEEKTLSSSGTVITTPCP